ncbi:septin-2-like isoform X3 [Bolinopsis microptera]|uniref:septin-2-like isoform X3 n=1 Tax=Bolinopsis microptera TaxID=2820187 RepID=UPI00307A9919
MSEGKEGRGRVRTGGYVGFADLPNQVHRKSVKKGFEFTLMVVGESGLGKSTLVNSLFLTDLYAKRAPNSAKDIFPDRINKTVSIETNCVEIEEKGVRLRLTVVDTPGFGDALNNDKCEESIIKYVANQYEAYLQDESGLNRRNIVDNRVHCCLYFISPYGRGLKPIDIKFMRSLHDKVNIVPVIAKADTLTKTEIRSLKARILEEIEEASIRIYQFPECDSDEDEDFVEMNKDLKESLPFAVIGSNTFIVKEGNRVIGRQYPWGVVEVENPEHSDFGKLRNMLIRTHMQDLKEVTRDVHYENFRSQKLSYSTNTSINESTGPKVVDETDKIIREKDEELKRMQRMVEQLTKQQNMLAAMQKQ